MLPGPPSIPTTVTPDEIVGAMMTKFLEHFEVCGSGIGEFPDSKLDKFIGSGARKTIADVYEDLRAHGFYPSHIANKKMVWMTAIKCNTHSVIEKHEPFDKDISSMSTDEMKEKARNGFRRVG